MMHIAALCASQNGFWHTCVVYEHKLHLTVWLSKMYNSLSLSWSRCTCDTYLTHVNYLVLSSSCTHLLATFFSYPFSLQGIDPERKLFYITIPESPTTLSRVNCLLAAGNTISPHILVPQDHIKERCPYLLPSSLHTHWYQNIWQFSTQNHFHSTSNNTKKNNINHMLVPILS